MLFYRSKVSKDNDFQQVTQIKKNCYYSILIFSHFFRYLYKNIYNMATIIIKENSPQAKRLLEYIKTLPFATVVEEKKNFRETAKKCTTDQFRTI